MHRRMMERRIPMNRRRGNPRAAIPVDKSADSVPAWLSGKRVRSGEMRDLCDHDATFCEKGSGYICGFCLFYFTYTR